jgi:hypothetical protein
MEKVRVTELRRAFHQPSPRTLSPVLIALPIAMPLLVLVVSLTALLAT